jgi:alpha-tubulin suppressor-like RCC1 family protein
MIRPITVALALFVSLVACSGPTEPTAVASVSLSPNTITLASGSSTTLAATTLDSKGSALTGRIITWSSSDASVAAVSATGVVSAGQNRGGSPALVTISASSEGKTGTATVSVTPVPVAKVIFAVDSIVIDPGVSTQLSIAVQDTAGIALTGRTITWTALDTTIAKVTASGQVTAVVYTGPDRRDTRVIANAENRADTVRIVVSPLAVARVILSPDTLTLRAGTSKQLVVIPQDAQGNTLTGRTVSWTVSDTTVVNVSTVTWLLTAISYLGPNSRTSRIIAAVGQKADTLNVLVSAIPVARVLIDVDSINLSVGMLRQVSSIVYDSSGTRLTDRSVHWQSSDTSVVMVSSSGTIQTPWDLQIAGKTAFVIARSELSTDTVRVKVLANETQVLASGTGFSCALDVSGLAYCWGSNSNGQLGDGTTTDRATPVAVAGGLRFKSLVAGNVFACGLSIAGAAFCWGNNSLGRLGDGTQTNRLTPVAVAGNLSFVALYNGGINHTCGQTSAGDLYCWGYNYFGQLGDGTTINRSTPVRVQSDIRFISLAINNFRTCGIAVEGTTYCWGRGYENDLPITSPQMIPFNEKFVKLSIGEVVTCGITISARTVCWGTPGNSLDASLSATIPKAIDVPSGKQLVSISLGTWHACGQDSDGNVFCWGQNFYGQLGISLDIGRTVSPTAIVSSAQFASLSLGATHSCGLTTTAQLVCWGSHMSYQLTSNILVGQFPPVRIQVPQSLNDIFGGSPSHTCGKTVSDVGYCWGNNRSGQLGNGAKGLLSTPVTINLNDSKFAQLSTSSNGRTCGIASVGGGYCWGQNVTSPFSVSSSLVLRQIDAGPNHTCGLDSTGIAYCWGSNTYGQLGDSSLTDRTAPTAVISTVRFRQVDVGTFHTCAISTTDQLFCWGRGEFVGDSSSVGSRTTPYPVQTSQKFTKVSVSVEHSCAIALDQRVYCWGRDPYQYGNLGRLDLILLDYPLPVTADNSSFVEVYTSYWTSCGLKSSGNAFCWGLNRNNLFLSSNIQSSSIPTLVYSGGLFSKLALGDNRLCGLIADGGVECWGDNSFGSLGTEMPAYLPLAYTGPVVFMRP